MLYLLSSPIGNIKDITLRTLEVLEEAGVLLCEDTRVTARLLDLLKIKNKPKLVSYYQEVESQKLSEVLGYLNKGMKVGLISDAGSPIVSDPGWLLVKTCLNAHLEMTALPGASAIIPALQLSGLPASNFYFVGFLPKSESKLTKVFEDLAKIDATKIAYESPERIIETLNKLRKVYVGKKMQVALCRELTKKFEKIVRGSIDNVIEEAMEADLRGEIVLLWN